VPRQERFLPSYSTVWERWAGRYHFTSLCGSFLGLWELIRAGVLGSFAAGFVIVFLLATKKTTLKGHLPLAPFLFAGAVLSFYL